MNLNSRLVFSMGLLSLLCFMLPGSLRAGTVTVFMNSTGAVASADRSATFDSVTTGTSLTSYSEDGLLFSIPGATAFEGFTPAPAGFSGNFFYPSGGSLNPLTITTTDSALLYGIQFFLGSGFSSQDPAGALLPIAYQLSLGVNVLGSGTFDAVQTSTGYLVGFRDPSGFGTLTITNCGVDPCTLGSVNAIAIDNVTADITAPLTTVPEPTSLMLLGTGLLGLMALAARSKREASRISTG
jgi:hypothetical protein